MLRDRWGINHIYAGNEHDLVLRPGLCAARDRLFQFELWRRQATGTVAEILGPKELKGHRHAPPQIPGDLRAELNWYHPHGEAIVTAYVAGVNAYIAEAMRTPATLPVEFPDARDPRHASWTPGRGDLPPQRAAVEPRQEVNLAQARGNCSARSG